MKLFSVIKGFIQKNKWLTISILICWVLGNFSIIYYVHQEHCAYPYDYMAYWAKFDHLTRDFLKNPLQGFKELLFSVRNDDYNYLFVLPLMPIGAVFGTGRLCYILSIFNIYAIPAVISFAFLNKRLQESFNFNKINLSVISVFLLLFFPNFWFPILRGYPDVGGIILINVLFLLYLRKPYQENGFRDLLLMGALIALLVLFRRWYAFWAVSFYVCLAVVEFWKLMVESKLRSQASMSLFSKILIQIFLTLLIYIVAAPILTKRIIQTNYSDIYSAFQDQHYWFTLGRLIPSFGLFIFILFLTGFLFSLSNKKARNFTVMLILQWMMIVVSFIHVQVFHSHQPYMLMPTMLLFVVLLISYLISGQGFVKKLVFCALSVLFALNFLAMFWPNCLTNNKYVRGMTTHVTCLPLVQNDLNEILRLASVLEECAHNPKDHIYVLSGGLHLNPSTFLSLSLAGYDQGLAKRICKASIVDKRDGFPLRLLDAQYVVVTDPVQFAVKANDSFVLSIPAECILKKQGIGDSFEKLPYTFQLDGCKAYIFRRIKPITFSGLSGLSEQLQEHYPHNPFVYKATSQDFLRIVRMGEGVAKTGGAWDDQAKSTVPADFDWKQYIANYPDLQRAGIDTEKKAEKHWIEFGFSEGRNYKVHVLP